MRRALIIYIYLFIYFIPVTEERVSKSITLEKPAWQAYKVSCHPKLTWPSWIFISQKFYKNFSICNTIHNIVKCYVLTFVFLASPFFIFLPYFDDVNATTDSYFHELPKHWGMNYFSILYNLITLHFYLVSHLC